MANMDFVRDLLIGGVSAAISKTIVAPNERVRLQLQIQAANKRFQDGNFKRQKKLLFFITIIKSNVKQYTGTLNCFRRVASEEGISALWRGNLTNVMRYIPTQALNFAFKDQYKKISNPFNPNTDKYRFLLGNIASGGAAGVSTAFVLYPLDMARAYLAADMGRQERQFTGLTDCILKLYQQGGVKGLYYGFDLSAIGIIIYRGLYFGLFDTAKSTILKIPFMKNIYCKFMVAYVITVVAGIASYPLDTIRRRLMMQAGTADIEYTGIFDCFRKIIQREGVMALFKGAQSHLFNGVCAALVLVLYDELQHLVSIPKAQ